MENVFESVAYRFLNHGFDGIIEAANEDYERESEKLVLPQ